MSATTTVSADRSAAADRGWKWYSRGWKWYR